MSEPITVVVVDAHVLVRRGVVDLLRDQPDITVCGEAGTTAEAIEVVRERQPSVVVVDVMLGGESGLDLVHTFTRHHAPVRSLVLSAQDEYLFAERALRAGALGYLSKSTTAAELQRAIRLVASGELAVSDRVSKHILSALARRASGATSPLEQLSNRELHVFSLVGQGKSTREVAAQLGLSPKTIETYYGKIKQKLALRSSRELTRAALAWLQDSQK